MRLLQRFDTFTLAPEYQPEGSTPPPSWKTKKGRQAIEKCWPAAAMTLFVKVGDPLFLMLQFYLLLLIGWFVGEIWKNTKLKYVRWV